MANNLSLNKFLETLNNKNYQKDIKLNCEAVRLTTGKYEMKIKNIEISKELFKELGLKEKIKVKKPKQPSRLALVEEKVSRIENKIDKFIDSQTKFNNILLSLPTIKRETKKVLNKEKDQEREK